jgi:recombination protein RecA
VSKNITAADLFGDLTNVIGENADATSIRGWLDTGLPELNWAMGGSYDRGAPMGRFIEIYGGASSGKTFIATMLMQAAQKKGGIAFFSDHERSFSPEFAKTLGLNVDPTVFKHLRPETFEDSIEAFKRVAPMVREKGLPMEVPLVWVFDSVAAMIPRSLLYEMKGSKLVRREKADANMRDKLQLATCTSINYPVLKQFAEDYNVTVILLNQIRLDPGVMFGNPEKTPGGKSGEFYADIRVSLGKKDVTNGKKGDEKEVLGFEITANTVKNKVTRPFRKAMWQVRFHDELGVYVDRVTTLVNFLIRKNILEKDTSGRTEWEGKKIFVTVLIKDLKADEKGIEKLMALVDNEKLEASEDAE